VAQKNCGLSDDDPIRLAANRKAPRPTPTRAITKKADAAPILSEGKRFMAATLDEVRRNQRRPPGVLRKAGANGFRPSSQRGLKPRCSPAHPRHPQRAQEMDDLTRGRKTYSTTTNFPPYSVGENPADALPGRREVGHGAPRRAGP